jgi:quinol monooxygenase YgiN
MYGTVARMRVKQENRDKLEAVFRDQDRPMKGFVGTYVLTENDSENIWVLAVFEDRATYDANADDPAQHEQYERYRALLEEEPEWHDGEIQHHEQ